jgi:hypothetical protein
MLKLVGVVGILGAEDVGVIAPVEAIGPEPEVQLAPCFDGAEADAIAEVEGIAAPSALAGCACNVVSSAAGDVLVDQARLVGRAGGFKGQLVAVASAFVDEVALDFVVKLELQLGEIDLGQSSGFEFEALLLDELLELKVVEASLGGGLNGGLSPSVVPFKGASGLGLGDDAGDGSGENGGQDLDFHG